ncbi:Uncharacterised protein [Citrobacter freundii]|nr:Uncharacterised protein [Citrobacter freundii]
MVTVITQLLMARTLGLTPASNISGAAFSRAFPPSMRYSVFIIKAGEHDVKRGDAIHRG